MNSPLATYRVEDKDSYGKRTQPIDTATVHCFACQVTAKRGADALMERSDAASANYIIGYDGAIAVNVDEDKASKCSSNRANDMRAVTIEVSCDNYEPYKVTDKAYSALIELLTDVCRRNGIKALVWSTNKSDRINHRNGCNMTVHRDYANKACPGEYLYNRMGDIAAKVNKKLQEEEDMTEKEVRAIVAKMLRGEGTVVPGWAKNEMAEAIELGVTDGSRPLGYATRSEVALMVKRAVKGEKPLKYIAGALIEKVKALLNKEDKS